MEQERLSPRLVASDISVGPPGGEPILRGVNLEVDAGEWLGITGANGSGKTTLALALAGLARVRQGRVCVAGEPLLTGSASRTRVAAILQEPGSQLLCDRVLDEIALTAINLGIDRGAALKAAREIAERLAIRELEQNPAALSAGRQQVVLLAAALAARPAVLIADEALAHVDAPTRYRVQSVLKEETSRGLAVIWVTQSAAELANADRAIEVTRHGIIAWRQAQASDSLEPRTASASVQSEIGRIRVKSNSNHDNRIRVEHSIEIPIPTTGLVVVTGANGVGKTTLLEAIAGGFDRPEVEVEWLGRSGSNSFSGSKFGPLLVGERPETQIVHEQVADEVVYAATARGRSRSESLAHARELLRALPFGTDLLERRTWSLSVGEKRVVLNIGGLIAPTTLLAIDEPTAGLDAGGSEAMANLVQQRATSGPVFVATQDVDRFRGLAGHYVDLGVASSR